MNTLICICSKSPNPALYDCIDRLYRIQIKDDPSYKICVVDSDSDNLEVYERVNRDFPYVEIFYIKNKNYEYGAWKYIHAAYPDYDIYFCIQDTIMIDKRIDLEMINDRRVYTCHHIEGYSGYNSHLTIKAKGIENLTNSGLNYESIIHTDFTLALYSIFIVSNTIMKDIFKTLQNPPIDKDGSCFYERNFGLYFILKNINTLDMNNYITKIAGKRQ
jgi:hypothetical protein